MKSHDSNTADLIRSQRWRPHEFEVIKQASVIKEVAPHAFIKKAAVDRAKRIVRNRQ